MKTRCIIICGGEATRWNNYLGVPKHLIKIEDETLIGRLVRQLKSEEREIYIVTKKKDKRYDIEGSKQYVAKIDYKNNADADKFLSSKSLWNKNGRTIVFYGDVWFSDEAIETILAHKGKDWILFGRSTASSITGCGYGECFAQSFYPKDLAIHEQNLHKIARAYQSNAIDRCGGWEHYRAMAGLPLKGHKIRGFFKNINDFTEDFDTPEDYISWIYKRSIYLSEKNNKWKY